MASMTTKFLFSFYLLEAIATHKSQVVGYRVETKGQDSFELRSSACLQNGSPNVTTSLEGEWLSSTNGIPYLRTYCKSQAHTDRSCTNRLQRKFGRPREYRTSNCLLQDFRERTFAKALGDRELYFIGDSVMMQQKSRLTCDLQNSSMVKSIRISHTNHLIANLHRLHKIPASSIALINVGLHFNNRYHYREFLDKFEEVCLKRRCTSARMIWQETAAQHFPASKGGYFKKRSKCLSGCVAISREKLQRMDFRNKMANEVMDRYGIPVLHVWELTQNAHDMHVQFNSHSGMCDCTHFCNVQYGVFRAYNQVLQAWFVQNVQSHPDL